MRLTEEQESLVQERVLSENFHLKELADDLIDHLCCYLEQEGKEDQDFERQLEKAIETLAPEGLISLEKRTLLLLNPTKILIMKRFLFTFGLLSSIAITLGVLFKLMSWPAANMLIFGGSLTFLFIFLPFWTLDRFKFKMLSKGYDRWRLISGLSAGISFGLSLVFKTMHLMGANVLLVLSALIFALFFLPLYFFKIYKKSIKVE